MAAAYDFAKLVAACDDGTAFVTSDAVQTARTDFKLQTEKAVREFVAGGGLEELKFVKSSSWEKNPNPKDPIMIDVYEFYTGNLRGYIAFRYQPATNKWTIKSFKLNDKPSEKFNHFAVALKKALPGKLGG